MFFPIFDLSNWFFSFSSIPTSLVSTFKRNLNTNRVTFVFQSRLNAHVTPRKIFYLSRSRSMYSWNSMKQPLNYGDFLLEEKYILFERFKRNLSLWKSQGKEKIVTDFFLLIKMTTREKNWSFQIKDIFLAVKNHRIKLILNQSFTVGACKGYVSLIKIGHQRYQLIGEINWLNKSFILLYSSSKLTLFGN